MRQLIPMLSDVYKYDKKTFIRIIILTFISSLTDGITILMLIPLMDFFNFTSESTNPIVNWLMQVIGAFDAELRLIILLIAYIMLISGKAVLSRKVSILDTELVQGYTRFWRNRLFVTLTKTDWQQFISHKHSELISSFTVEINRLSSSTLFYLKIIILSLTALIQIIIAFMLSPSLTLLVFVCGIGLLMLFRPMLKRSKKFGEKLMHSHSNLAAEINSQIGGIKEFRVYGVEKFQRERFFKVTGDVEKNYIYYSKISSIPTMMFSIGAAILISLFFYCATIYMNIDTPVMIIIVYIFARLWPSFSSIQSYFQNIISVLPIYQRLCELVKNLSEKKISLSDDVTKLSFNNQISFSHVYFHYNYDNKNILNDVSFNIKAKKITALSGVSGAGKSTIVDLLLFFLQAQSGTVTIDNEILCSENEAAWRKNVGFVPQEPLLFRGTIRENLQRFHPNAGKTDLIKALKASRAWDFIVKLPSGIDTEIGDSGTKLSGGEGQRIALARALVGKPSLIILDEATNSLDRKNEQLIRETLKKISSQAAVLIIAHSVSMINCADEILEISNGIVTKIEK